MLGFEVRTEGQGSRVLYDVTPTPNMAELSRTQKQEYTVELLELVNRQRLALLGAGSIRCVALSNGIRFHFGDRDSVAKKYQLLLVSCEPLGDATV